jgi:hypothetical protein
MRETTFDRMKEGYDDLVQETEEDFVYSVQTVLSHVPYVTSDEIESFSSMGRLTLMVQNTLKWYGDLLEHLSTVRNNHDWKHALVYLNYFAQHASQIRASSHQNRLRIVIRSYLLLKEWHGEKYQPAKVMFKIQNKLARRLAELETTPKTANQGSGTPGMCAHCGVEHYQPGKDTCPLNPSPVPIQRSWPKMWKAPAPLLGGSARLWQRPRSRPTSK